MVVGILMEQLGCSNDGGGDGSSYKGMVIVVRLR